jgi:hypothetical protein
MTGASDADFPVVDPSVYEAVDKALEPHIPTLPTTRQVVAQRIAYKVAERFHSGVVTWGDRKNIVIDLIVDTNLREQAAWDVVQVAVDALKAAAK